MITAFFFGFAVGVALTVAVSVALSMFFMRDDLKAIARRRSPPRPKGSQDDL